MRSAPARSLLLLLIAMAAPTLALAQQRLIVIDQDTSGPGGSNIMSMLALLQSPQVDVLGITVVTGNAWRDDEARHALRMLELIGRSDVPVALGAVFPLMRTQQETRLDDPAGGAGRLVGRLRPEIDHAKSRAGRTHRAAGAGSAARSLGYSAAARGRAAYQTHRRGRAAFPDPTSPCPPASGHHLRGGATDRHCPRHSRSILTSPNCRKDWWSWAEA